MKKAFIIVIVIAGISLGATVLASVIVPKLRPPKQEMPEVIVNGEQTGVRGYVANFSVEISKSCPRDLSNFKEEQTSSDLIGENSEGNVVVMKHCSRCSIGIYSEHHDEEEIVNGMLVKRCSYCGVKE